MTQSNDNLILSRSTILIFTADFILFFTILNYISTSTDSNYIGAYSVSIKSLGTGLGALALPFFVNRFPLKRLVLMALFLVSAVFPIFLWAIQKQINVAVIFAFLIIQSFSLQIFSGARECLSKSLGPLQKQRSLQAEILTSFFGAQFLGPFLGFFLARSASPYLTVSICTVLSLFSFIYSFKIKTHLQLAGTHIFQPFKYLPSNKPLLKIFIIRGVLHWIPIGIFNYFLFSIISSKFNLGKEYSAWIYCLIAFGSIVATYTLQENALASKIPILRKGWKWFHNRTDKDNASFAYFILAATRILFLIIPNFALASLVFVSGGFANGLNLASAQSLRRHLSTDVQHPEIVGLEAVFARMSEWLIGTACMFLASQKMIRDSGAIVISAIFLLLLGFYVKSINLKTINS